jgi:phage terminase large subunit
MSLRSEIFAAERDLGDLLVSRKKGRSLEDIAAKYREDPAGFIREELKAEPWEAQVRMAEAVAAHQLVLVQSCNAAGKDWLAARLALWWVYARRGLVLITGPTERQVREIVMGEVKRAWTTANLPGELYSMALRVDASEAVGILAFTSDDPSRLTGLHAPRIMVVITEGQGVPGFTYEAALANAMAGEDRILVVGNPLSPTGFFYEASQSPDWHRIVVSAEDHPNVRSGRAEIPGGITREGVERIRRTYGESSPIFTARVLGQFPTEAVEQLIRREWIERAVEQWTRQNERGWGGTAVFAVDVAHLGPDRTCLAVWQANSVRGLVTWGGLDTSESADRVEDEAEALGVKNPEVVIDATGLGWGLYDTLKRRGQSVVAFVAAKSARESDRFANSRTEAAWLCREALQAGVLPLPDDPELHEELLAQTWILDPQGRIALPPKDEIRSRLKRSPDKADALFMVAWHIRPASSVLPEIDPGALLEGTGCVSRVSIPGTAPTRQWAEEDGGDVWGYFGAGGRRGTQWP